VTIQDTSLSRAISHALRHEPWLYDLELDVQGWAPLDQLVDGLRKKGGDWESIDRSSVERIVTTAVRRRHELNGDRIRALYGHSRVGRVRKPLAVPPAQLFHGTTPEAWVAIEVDGLLPMERHFVHLSTDRAAATSVGLRKSTCPIILVVDAAAAISAGVAFYVGNDQVWLAESVPARFVRADGTAPGDGGDFRCRCVGLSVAPRVVGSS
jgi:putative RNA 2'-phosphotransferase